MIHYRLDVVSTVLSCGDALPSHSSLYMSSLYMVTRYLSKICSSSFHESG